MRISLSDHFTYKKLFRFTLPSILMMIFTSIYSVVDGFFVSNYAGKTALAAINLIYPVISILGAFGFMIGTGGAAIVGRMLGQRQEEEANRTFSMFIIVTFIVGVAFALLGIAFVRPLGLLLGASENMIDDCVLYGRIVLCGMPFFMLQYMFQTFFSTAEKPKLGLAVTVAAGCTNIVLDALFVAVFKWGLTGAAAATALSQAVGGTIPLVYFGRKNTSLLHFTKPKFSGRILLRACGNGSSELMSNIASSIVAILFNWQLLRLLGEDGVAAYGVIGYISFIFAAIFIGYSMGCSPIVSFNYGAENRDELQSIFKKTLKIIPITGVVMAVFSFVTANPLAKLFVGYDDGLCELTVRALRIYSFSYLLAGLNIFGSSFFTALNNGAVSALISFLRTLVFQVACVLLLPLVLGSDGIWASLIVSELLSLVVTVFFLAKNRKKYGYA